MSLPKLFTQGCSQLLPTGFASIIFIMVVTSLFAIINIKNNSDSVSEMVAQQNHNSQLLNTMTQTALERSVLLIEMIQANDFFEIDEKIIEFNAAGTKFALARAALVNQNINSHLQVMLNKQGKLQKDNNPLLHKVISLIQEDQKEQAVSLFTNEVRPNKKQVISIIKNMMVLQNTLSKDIISQTKNTTNKSLASLLFFILFSFVTSIALTRYIIKKQQANNRALTQQATTDALTKLPNRSHLIKNIESIIRKEPSSIFAIIFFDIDYFKTINDNYGHEVGDKILRKFAETIKSHITKKDILSRFGGDEFVLLLRSIDSPINIKEFIKNLSEKLDTSFIIDDQEIFISTSIGVSFYSEDANDARTLLKYSDIAMYSAKESGRNNYSFFSKKTIEKMEKEHALSHSLHSILKNNNKTNELNLLYQPLLNIDDENISECEALIRWTTTKGEIIPPDEFIPLAEKSNLIEKINSFVIDEACQQQYKWQKTNFRKVRININLSGNKLIFNRLLNQFKQNLVTLNLDASLFGIELTERTLFEISKDTIEDLDQLRKQGVKISIDDFGTGYSSLSYLKKLPITTLKIDKGFIAGLPEDQDDHALVKAIITLGHSLNLDIVAEGVETAEQLAFLKEHSCNIAQGYYFHRPLDSHQFSQLKVVA